MRTSGADSYDLVMEEVCWFSSFMKIKISQDIIRDYQRKRCHWIKNQPRMKGKF